MTPTSALSAERESFIYVCEGFRRLKDASDSIYIMDLGGETRGREEGREWEEDEKIEKQRGEREVEECGGGMTRQLERMRGKEKVREDEEKKEEEGGCRKAAGKAKGWKAGEGREGERDMTH